MSGHESRARVEEGGIPDIPSIEAIITRPNYRASLYFTPRHDRRFGSIVAPYHLSGEKTKCGIADCGSPHWHGYLITTSDGLETNIGKDCGTKHFEADFKAEMRRHDAIYNRKLRVTRIIEMKKMIPSVLDGLNQLESRSKQQQELRSRLRGAVEPSVLKQLTDRARTRNTRITKAVQLRGKDAEAFYEANPDRRRPAIREDVIGELRGLEAFRVKLHDILDIGVIPRIAELHKLSVADIEGLPAKRLAFWAKFVGELPGKITEAIALADAGDRFFHSTNLEAVALLDQSPAALQAMIKDQRAEEATRAE